MAINFFLSSKAAERFLNQAEKQLDTARRVNGELAAAVATRNVQRSENLYGQVNNFLGLATTNNNSAKREISDMARDAVIEPERELVQVYTARTKDIDTGINGVRLSSTQLITELGQARYNEQNNAPRPAVTSSGADAIEAQRAADDDARAQNPPAPLQTFNDEGELIDVPENVSEDTNADQPRLLGGPEDIGNDDGSAVVGANRPTVILARSQGAGAPGAPSDDQRSQPGAVSGSGIAEGGRPAIAPEFLAPIIPTPNPLAKLASMNYAVSIYLLNIEEYKRMLIAQKKVLPTQQLIIQSGGIDQGAGFGIGQRNKYFDVDFYLDNINIDSSIGTQGGTRAHNALTLNFTVTEPTGITFIQRLRKAVREHQNIGTSTVSEANQNFLMVIRFYGYDANGQMVNGSQLGIKEVGSDNNAVIEKWIPFQIADIRYKLANKVIEYVVTATVPQTAVGFSQMYATIPFDFELQAPDVATLLNGKTVLSRTNTANNEDLARDQEGSSNPPPNATPISALKQYTNGLAQALNEHQKNLVDTRQQQRADQYEIVIANVKGLSDAKIARPGRQDKQRTATPPPTTANQALNPQTSSYNNNSKTWSVTRGTQIVQLIDLVIRNSTYITSQQNVIFDEQTKQPKAQTPVATVQWFRIGCQVTPLEYDNIRRNLSYKIVYTVSPYQINDPRVAVFPPARFRGTHKVYNYWFTGENAEVLDLDIQVDYNYTTTFSNFQGGVPFADWTSSSRIYEKRAFQNKPNSEGTGGTGDTTTPAAQLAERLYNDADIQKASLTIIGDPDWVQQSEVFYNDPKSINLSPFMPDGSVNTAASEVLYEIKFNPVNDYNLSSGLAAINSNGGLYGQTTADIALEPQSTVFNALLVKSNFRQGKFTQRLIGAVRYFNPATATGQVQAQGSTVTRVNAEQNASADGIRGQQADVRRVDNQIAANETAAARARFLNGALPAPTDWADPYGTSDAAAIIAAQAGPPSVKPGSSTPNDDEASAFSPFQA
jgi:hypothetical protein